MRPVQFVQYAYDLGHGLTGGTQAQCAQSIAGKTKRRLRAATGCVIGAGTLKAAYLTEPVACAGTGAPCEAEREGFEPSRVISPTRFRDARTQPNYATSPQLECVEIIAQGSPAAK